MGRIDQGRLGMPRFTTPPDSDGFNEAMWEMVRQTPAGKVCAYGRIAELVGPPAGMGGAMAHCRDDVHWWRVINAHGKISAREGAQRRRTLLEAEGVEFDGRGRVSLAEAGWDG
jgi:methylated-DNA-protein-cysteine methyltransferase-like protein